MLTYAQNFEDVILSRLFSEKRAGFYIDVGASHPEEYSVTKHFYDLGWSGINIEPIPSSCNQFVDQRPRDLNLNVAIDATPGARTLFEVVEFGALSTFDIEQSRYLRNAGYHLNEYEVKTLTLDQIFESHVSSVVDFLKIDVEGSEELVLKSIDLTRYRPRVLVIESMQPGREFPGWGNHHLVSNWPWEDLVTSQGYIFAYYDGISRFYVRLEDQDLLRRFELPPGCFDDIHRPEEYRLATQIQEIDLQLQTAKSEIARLSAKVLSYAQMDATGRFRFLVRYIKSRIKQITQDRLHSLTKSDSTLVLPKITVVTPVYNCHKHVAATIESVLSQDYPYLEYIIVDGGSTDGTLEIIHDFARRNDFKHQIALLISEPDSGMYDAIAKGFDRASGDIFCYLNADDLLECGGLLSVGNYFANNQNMHVIYHEDIVMVGEWKYPNIKQPKNISTIDFLCGHILFQDGVFWRRTAYETVGGLRRDLKLAGDFDLWLRLSARFRFIKRPNHVSCFRIRDGQLSGDIGNYHEEMTVCIEDFLSNTHILSRSLNPLKKRLRAVFKRIEMSRQKRFHYSIDSSAIPPTTNECIEPITGIPRSPIDGKPAERLIFSSPDTRFGEPDLSYIYYDERHQIAITHPPVPAARLDSLYRKHYSHPPSEMVLPKGKSPYRYYNGMKIWERIVLRLPVECLVRFIPNTWDDDTLNELCKILKKSGLNTKSSLRFLDTGCFEGHLLSQVREKTHWNAFGIEPNQAAVETARSKGHQVWIGYAEDATAVIPKHHQFDVIYMGQSIEHVDDPVLVLKKLRQILAPGGILVMSTPNLDSRQIDWFGPTWAHWHTPYHRHIFSPNSLVALAQQVGLLPIKLMSFSHPYWTTMSVAQNWLGLGGSTSHAVTFDRSFTRKAQRIHFWNYVLWNRIGKGDYCFISMKDGSDD